MPVRREGLNTRALDAHVGGRLRLARMMAGLNQTALGATLGVSFQQVQKYERGANRIGAGQIPILARVLDVPYAFFFDEIPADAATPSRASALKPNQRLALRVMGCLDRIEDHNRRIAVLNLARVLAEAGESASRTPDGMQDLRAAE